jgi:hypothetical protein
MTALTMTRGDTAYLDINVTHPNEEATLAGCTLKFTAKRDYSDAQNAAVISKSTANGITITGDLTATVKILPTDTSSLEAGPVVLYWDLELTDATPDTFTVASGTLTINPDVTTG